MVDEHDKKTVLGGGFLVLLLGSLFAGNAQADVLTLNNASLISVVGVTAPSAEFKNLCKILQNEVASWSLGTQTTPTCENKDLVKSKAQTLTKSAQTAPTYGTLVQINDNLEKKTYQLSIENLHPVDGNEPKVLRWTIKKVPTADVMIRKILRNYAQFDLHKEDFKKNALSNALGYRVKDADFSAAYKNFVINPENARYMAATLEIAGSLAVSVYNYYSEAANTNSNARDWDFLTAKDSFDKKSSGEGIRFDDNHYRTNKGHYLAGTGYDIYARSAGATRLQSLLFTFVSSSFWEYAGEYREVVSINDQLNTTFGGFILGETIFQMTKILRKSDSNSAGRRILDDIFGGPERMSGVVENSLHHDKRDFTDLDLSDEEEDFWSKLDFNTGANYINGNFAHSYGLSGEVINIPMYETPGKVSRTYLNDDTVQSELNWDMGSGPAISEYLRLFAKVTLSAIYQKNLTLDDQERLEGYQMFIGPAMALEVNDTVIGSNLRENGSDFMGIVHVLGGTANITTYSHGIRMHTVLDIYGDFAMMHSPSFDTTTGDNFIYASYTMSNCGTIQSVLCHEGYYYGFGSTEKLKTVMDKDGFEIGASASSSDENLINGRSRFYENTQGLNGKDIVGILNGWVAYSFTRNLRIEIGVEKSLHRSSISGPQIPSAATKLSDTVKYGRLVWKFD